MASAQRFATYQLPQAWTKNKEKSSVRLLERGAPREHVMFSQAPIFHAPCFAVKLITLQPNIFEEQTAATFIISLQLGPGATPPHPSRKLCFCNQRSRATGITEAVKRRTNPRGWKKPLSLATPQNVSGGIGQLGSFPRFHENWPLLEVQKWRQVDKSIGWWIPRLSTY